MKLNCVSVLHIPIAHAHDISKKSLEQKKYFLSDFLLWDFTIKKLVKISAAI